jgi:hypothetical protein
MNTIHCSELLVVIIIVLLIESYNWSTCVVRLTYTAREFNGHPDLCDYYQLISLQCVLLSGRCIMKMYHSHNTQHTSRNELNNRIASRAEVCAMGININ